MRYGLAIFGVTIMVGLVLVLFGTLNGLNVGMYNFDINALLLISGCMVIVVGSMAGASLDRKS